MRQIPANPTQAVESFQWLVVPETAIGSRRALPRFLEQRLYDSLHRHHPRAFDEHHVTRKERLA
jgi:hypothetical protein